MSHPLKWLSLIAVERPELPAFESAAAWYAEHFPTAPRPIAAGSTDKLLTLTLGDFTAAATLVPRPIPWSQLEGMCEAAAWHWPTATDAMQNHAAHLLVTLVDEAGRAIEKAAALTRITASLSATAPAVGVVWGPGRLVHAAAAFVDQAMQMSDVDLPLFLWIDFRIEPIEDGDVRLYTTGLEALGASELEVDRFTGPPQQLLELAYNIAHYQLTQRKAIRDGETIGVSEQFQATVRRGPSKLDAELEVIHLEFEA